MKNDSFTALRQIILTSGTLLKEDLHKVCSLEFVRGWVLMSLCCIQVRKSVFYVVLLNTPSLVRGSKTWWCLCVCVCSSRLTVCWRSVLSVDSMAALPLAESSTASYWHLCWCPLPAGLLPSPARFPSSATAGEIATSW